MRVGPGARPVRYPAADADNGSKGLRRSTDVGVAVIGGGQAGLAAGYFLRRAKADFVILDAQSRPGGAWRHGWDSLRLFSPARYSPLPGWWMPDQPGEPFPTAGHVRDYLTAYEARYQLPVRHNVDVEAVHYQPDHLEIRSRGRIWRADAVISATGTWRRPHWPRYPGAHTFRGTQIHTVSYHRPDPFSGQRVVVVGGGNSGRRSSPKSPRSPPPPGSPPDRHASFPTTSTAASCSMSPPSARARCARAAPTPAASPDSATSSWFPRSWPPGTGMS